MAQVKGEISLERLDQAVGRILRVKLRAGLFDAGLPSQRKYAGQYELLSAPEHRDVARRAVRQSLVLLKNNKQLLPLSPSLNLLVRAMVLTILANKLGVGPTLGKAMATEKTFPQWCFYF